ncbi:Ig-like domain-containing protein, partial [Neobacillus cucumis]|uniref:Ig-like domain-containing protein n=1 Tax=Neobacillus cucumis TaxID=1740721 RepID=UPI00203C15D8
MRKRIFSIIMVLLLVSGSFPYNFGKASADVTNPVIESIQVDKTEVTSGDTIKVSVKATDDVGVSRVYVYYKSPTTNKTIGIYPNYNSLTNSYEGSYKITSNSESGTYKVSSVYVYDTSDNVTYLPSYSDYENKLGSGQFTVSGTTADVTNPVLDSIQVDKTEVKAGDSVKVSVKATDNVGISRVYVYYKSPTTNKTIGIYPNYNSLTNSYEGSYTITSNSEAGTYKVSSVYVYDTSDNVTYLPSYSDYENKLGSGQFTVSGTTA